MDTNAGYTRSTATASDDSITAVVGAERAIRLLKEWRKLTQESGLIMAIPEKRSVGTWCLWVGILIFTTLGLVAIPKAKLLRAATALREAVEGRIEFAAYQSLLGQLEHFRRPSRVISPRHIQGRAREPYGSRLVVTYIQCRIANGSMGPRDGGLVRRPKRGLLGRRPVGSMRVVVVVRAARRAAEGVVGRRALARRWARRGCA